MSGHITPETAARLLEAASWAHDLILLYDDFLIELGESEARVRSGDHVLALGLARAAITQAEKEMSHD